MVEDHIPASHAGGEAEIVLPGAALCPSALPLMGSGAGSAPFAIC